MPVSRDKIEGLHTHIVHNSKLFIAFKTMSLLSEVIHIIYNPELFIACRALSSQPGVIHIIHNLELFIAFRAMAHDQESFISFTTLNYSYHVETLANRIPSHSYCSQLLVVHTI